MTEKKEHPKAELLRWIADGETIQIKYSTGWCDIENNAIIHSLGCTSALKNEFYRIKPKTIRIGKYDVAEPMKKPESRDCIYSVDFSSPSGVYSAYYGCEPYKHIVDSGVFWSNKEDAELAAKAIKELLTGQ